MAHGTREPGRVELKLIDELCDYILFGETIRQALAWGVSHQRLFSEARFKKMLQWKQNETAILEEK